MPPAVAARDTGRSDPAVAGAALVSVIVRSMGRPEVRGALESLARQDHPVLEVIVVDATGGRHPALPPIAWHPGHVLREVGTGTPLPRPLAADAGLRAARGDWCAFLDDDDTCDPQHISSLLAEASHHPAALVVYGTTRLLDAQGRVESLFGEAFNSHRQFYKPLFCWQAALFRREVVDLGCAFDPQFDVCEDRDFIAQVALHAAPVQVPVTGFNFRPDLGTSGTGTGANRNLPHLVRHEQLLQAKWAGEIERHSERIMQLCRRAEHTARSGDTASAQTLYAAVLDFYPDDPVALHGLAMLALDAGDLAHAERHILRAIEVHGDLPQLRVARERIAGRRHP